jgi:hypothetical protein
MNTPHPITRYHRTATRKREFSLGSPGSLEIIHLETAIEELLLDIP